MNKYIYSECSDDEWPIIKSIMANSYNAAVEKLINKFAEKFDDDNILSIDTHDDLQEYLNGKYNYVISDLEDIEEL